MDATNNSPAKHFTNFERTNEREMVVTRTFDAPVHIVFEAWSKAELFRLWWVPKSMGVPLRACEMDVRTGGKYRLEFGHDADNVFQFFGKYLDVVPLSRIVWTNDEGEEGAISTVTFEEQGDKTLLVFHELYPTKEALDEAMASGSTSGFEEQFNQLDDMLAASA